MDPRTQILAKLFKELRSGANQNDSCTPSSKGLVGIADKGGCRRDQVPSLNVLREHSKTG
jgi:hypothetical protein